MIDIDIQERKHIERILRFLKEEEYDKLSEEGKQVFMIIFSRKWRSEVGRLGEKLTRKS